jgi:hypothetical protein
MSGRIALAVASGVAVALGLVAAGVFWHPEVRHSAPYGFSKTIDFNRLISVRGGYVTANFDDFNRLDLDLRAYTPGATYDVTIHIRPAVPGAEDVRTIQLDLPAERIYHRKRAFADPFITIAFPPIADSAGKTYYVYVEDGIRNRDDVLALWSIKSYSRQSAWRVLSSFVDEAPHGPARAVVRLALILLMIALVFSAAWLLSALVWATARVPARR